MNEWLHEWMVEPTTKEKENRKRTFWILYFLHFNLLCKIVVYFFEGCWKYKFPFIYMTNKGISEYTQKRWPPTLNRFLPVEKSSNYTGSTHQSSGSIADSIGKI